MGPEWLVSEWRLSGYDRQGSTARLESSCTEALSVLSQCRTASLRPSFSVIVCVLLNPPQILHDDAILRLAVSRNVVFMVWLNAPEPGQVRAMGRALGTIATRYASDFGIFVVAEAGTPNFGDEIRGELAKLVRDPRLQGSGAAYAILVNGFAGVATRAFLSTIFLVARGASPNKVFSDVPAAAAWLAPRVSQGRERWTSTELLEGIASVSRKSPESSQPTVRPASEAVDT